MLVRIFTETEHDFSFLSFPPVFSCRSFLLGDMFPCGVRLFDTLELWTVLTAHARVAGFSKVNSFYIKALFAKSDEEATTNADELLKGIAKEIEPLLKGAGPFFGGSEKLTLAEVSFIVLAFYFFSPVHSTCLFWLQ